jgi:hypothetical protein
VADSASALRVLLEGDVLQIGFHGVGKAPYPEDVVPAAVLRAVAQYLKLDLGTAGVFWGDYCWFAGVTGEAFRFLEIMELGAGGPARPLVERYGHIAAEGMFRCAFDAAGLTAKMHLKPHLPKQEALRRMVVESLRDRRTPVIGLGVFGPPEPFLITGYEEDGEVLVGWSHFQAEKKSDPRVSFEPTGQFRLRGWYQAIDGIAAIEGAGRRPPARDVFRGALEQALRELATTAGSGGVLGTAAMEKWAARLEDDAALRKLSTEQAQKAQADHGSTAGDLAERRALAASFLGLACRALPEAASDLVRAQASFQGVHDTVYEIWETAAKSGPFDPDLAKFRDPARRRTMASLVRRLAELDRRAHAFIARALDTVGGKAPREAPAPDPVLDGDVELRKAAVALPAEPFWAPENIAFPNAMGMLAAFLGVAFGELTDAERSRRTLDYELWMGLSGAAFGMLWDGPERSNLPLAFDALGYTYELWMSQKLAEGTGLPCRVWGWDDNLRRRIFWNLRDRRLPVLLFGCGRWPDWWLITRADHWWVLHGYGGSGGEGYRPNEPLDHPKNPLRVLELMEGMKGKQTWTINVLGKRPAPGPVLADLCMRAVAWGAEKMGRQRMVVLDAQGRDVESSRPYADWAGMMKTDALFPPAEPETLKKRRGWLEGHEVELAERRFYGAGFLDVAARRLGRPELAQAAERFRAVSSLMERLWAPLGGEGAPDAYLGLGDPEVRAVIAGLLLQMEREDAAAAELLAKGARP